MKVLRTRSLTRADSCHLITVVVLLRLCEDSGHNTFYFAVSFIAAIHEGTRNK